MKITETRLAAVPHWATRKVKRDVHAAAHAAREWVRDRQLDPTLRKVRPLSLGPTCALRHLARCAEELLANSIPGDLVECGVWKGGASFLMADILRRHGARDRKVWLCDSFAGLPSPATIDGPFANAWAAAQADTASPHYRGNFAVALADVQQSAHRLGLTHFTEFVPGWFDQTLPVLRERIGAIALLRIDADWYASVLCCLEQLYDRVAPGGLILFDDYHSLDGCAVAVHEFLGAHHLSHRLSTYRHIAFIRKQ